MSSSRTDVRIREAVVSDSPQVAEMLGQLGSEIQTEEVAACLETRQELFLVAVRHSHVVGVLALDFLTTAARPQPVASITAVVVDAAARRQGVGRQLLERAAEMARLRGCGTVQAVCDTAAQGDAVERVFSSLGYENAPCFSLDLGSRLKKQSW
jgi:aminoglycoside 6'-N-acetyltransferase I